MTSRTPGRTFLDVDLARVVRVELLERVVEALRLEQELQVLLAAVLEEVLDFFVALDGLDDLGLRQGARVVLVDHLEDLARGVQKLGREGGDLRGRLLGPPLAVRGALRELRLERGLDGRFPA